MHGVFPVALLSCVKAPSEVFVNGLNITGRKKSTMIFFLFYPIFLWGYHMPLFSPCSLKTDTQGGLRVRRKA